MKSLKSRALLVASLAGLLAAPSIGLFAGEKEASGQETVHCYGVNKCKASGDCGGKGHSCANQNSCKRQGYIDMDKELCMRIDGGRLTPESKS